MMSFAPHISFSSGQTGNSLSGLWEFLYRVAAWLGLYDESFEQAPVCEPVFYVACRHDRRMARHMARRDIPISRCLSPLLPFVPKGFSENQFLERCTKLSVMGRFQIYVWLYYRWEYYRDGALKARNIMGLFSSIAAICHAPLWPS